VTARPRTPRRRALTVLLIGPLLCGLVLAGGITAAWVLLGEPVPAQGAVWFQVTKLGSARNEGGPQQPFFALILGTGARSDNPDESPDDPGLADAVHVIGVNPALKAATIIDIPRDTEGPGGAKINSYIVNNPGGNELRAEADAVSSIVGVPITWVIRANFPHFQQMVDEIGGIDVNIPAPMDDDFSGAHFAAGPAHLNGEQALQFSRDRHSFSNGDLSRTQNQGLLIISALQTLQAKHPSVGDTVRLIATLGRHTKLDGVGIADLFHMGSQTLSFDAANIKNVVLPVGDGPGSNLVKSGDAAGLLADFADDGVLQTH
jgi:LCP family protein required for cell wall assembly